MEKTFEREVLDRLAIIETKLDDYNSIKNKVEETNVLAMSNKKDIDDLKDKIKWITRTITTALITGVIGVIFTLLKLK